jgi:type I restriction enzyme S subunit
MSIRAPIADVNISDKVYGIGRGLCSIKAININSNYLWFYLKFSKSFIESLGTGSTFLAITGSDLSIVPIIFPPLHEQQAIADYLDKKTAEIDTQMDLIEKKIDAYKRLKHSLIDEVVTGKRKIS